MALLGKPLGIYKNSEGNLGFKFHYKYCDSDKIHSTFYTMGALNPSAIELIERAINDGDYLSVVRSYDHDIRFVDGVDTVVAEYVSLRRLSSVPSELIVKEYCPVKTGQGQYKVSF